MCDFSDSLLLMRQLVCNSQKGDYFIKTLKPLMYPFFIRFALCHVSIEMFPYLTIYFHLLFTVIIFHLIEALVDSWYTQSAVEPA